MDVNEELKFLYQKKNSGGGGGQGECERRFHYANMSLQHTALLYDL